MTPERWRCIEALFGRCLELAEAARQRLLAQECVDDPALRSVVEGMLAADSSSDDDLKKVIGACAGQTAEEPAEHWNGRVLGHYRIERQLGAGGMGTVFLARRSDAEYERRVAIKVLSNAFASADERRRFVSERQILANLAHPNIAQLHDGGTTAEGVPYLVMEYIEGVPIDEYCIAGKTPLKERLRLFLQVCAAVQYAHQNLVIHRDIKPANILVTADGTPKLLDFGIAKLLDAKVMPRTVAVTLGGARLLTPRHASPEQIKGLTVTTASDVYSLGVLLYRLLTDRYPYDVRADRTGEIERAILDTYPQRPSAAVEQTLKELTPSEARQRRRTLSGELDNIVLMALRKEPERRYATVQEFAHDIECYLTHRPVAARRDSGGYRLRKFIERHSAGVATGMLAAAALVALVSFHTTRLAEERDIQVRARAAAERVSQFMVDIFRVADPQSGQSDVSARELLDRAYGEIDGQFDAQPLIAAELMMAMGRAYGGLAMFDRSDELLGKAYELRSASLEEDALEIAEVLHHIGNTKTERGDFVAARASLDKALAIRQSRLGADALEVGDTLMRLAVVDMREGKYPQMRAALERSLDIHIATVGPDDTRTGNVYWLLNAYHWSLGEHAQARDALDRALAIEEHAKPPNHVRIAGLIHSRGLLAWQMGEYSQAIELYRRELMLRKKHLGAEHPSVANALYGIGVSSANSGYYREGFEAFREAAALQEKVLGPDSHQLAMTLGGYGFALLHIEDFVSAREALSRALAIFEARFGSSHPDLRAPLAGLSKVAIAERRFDEARERIERAFAIVNAKFPSDHPDVLRTNVSLADVFRAQGDYVKALDYYEPSVAALERTLGLDHPYAADALCGMGDALAQAGQLARADEYYRYARTNLADQKFTDRRAATAACLEGQAALLRKLDRQAEADEVDAIAGRIRQYVRAARQQIDARKRL